jgi:hypothetical protein
VFTSRDWSSDHPPVGFSRSCRRKSRPMTTNEIFLAQFGCTNRFRPIINEEFFQMKEDQEAIVTPLPPGLRNPNKLANLRPGLEQRGDENMSAVSRISCGGFSNPRRKRRPTAKAVIASSESSTLSSPSPPTGSTRTRLQQRKSCSTAHTASLYRPKRNRARCGRDFRSWS